MPRYLSFLCLCLLPVSAMANVLTSIKPIQMIVQELTLGVNKPEVLLSSTSSPHDYALRPSDVHKLNDADLVVWFGPSLEPFLTKILHNKRNVFTISDIKDLNLYEYGADHHDDGHHHHGTHNPHFWLGLEQSQQVAVALVDKLVAMDPAHATQYKQNLQQFILHVEKKQTSIANQLKPVVDKGYYVFHDAYGYFEKPFGLHNLGHFTVSPERKPGAKTLIRIRTVLREQKVQCVFSEPQFTPAVINSTIRGTEAKVGQLDPLGMAIDVKPGSYFTFIQSIADGYTDCLK